MDLRHRLREGAHRRGCRRIRHRARALASWLLALGAVAGAAAGRLDAQALDAAAPEILSVSFRGPEQLTEEALRTAIVTAPTRCVSAALRPLCWLGLSRDRRYLDHRALAADVFRLRVFYYQRGYREARVELDTVRVPRGMHVRFLVREGRPVVVHTIDVEGAAELGGGLERALPVRAGEPLSMLRFEAARDTLRRRLANRGHAHADVLANYDIPGSDPYRAELSFQLVPGPVVRFGPVEIAGADRVSPRVVERMLVFREGDLFSRQAMLRSQRNLFGLEVFRHAEIIAARVGDADSVLPVRVQVSEGDLNRVRVGVGMSTAEFLNAEGRWVSRNFSGGARRLEVRGRVSNLIAEAMGPLPAFETCSGIYCDVAGSLSADFTQPWFFGPRNSLGAGVFAERFTLPGVYVRSSLGGHLSLRRDLGPAGSVAGGYRPQLTELESDGDLIFCVNFVACEAREIDVLRDPHWLSPLALSFGLDRSNSLFAPTGGYIVRLDGEYASAATGSDFGYIRLLGEFSAYHDPFRGVVIATRLRPGWARATGAPGTGLGLHPQKRFFGGGPNSVRGYAHYRLGPKLLTVNAARTLALPLDERGAGCTAQEINAGVCDVTALARKHPGALDVRPVGGAALLEGNIEVRFPVWPDKLSGATFLDFGQVWQGHDDISIAGLSWTPGVGMRYLSPVGPIRIDVGYNPGGAERLTVVTTEVCHRVPDGPCGEIRPDESYAAADLANRRRLRTQPAVLWRPYDTFTDRLQFHFSIGQAF